MEDTEIVKLIDLAKRFSNGVAKITERQPYHVNLIDELHADENAHTRILAAILRYKTDLGYFNLKSFIEFEAENCPELNTIIDQIDKPAIMVQKHNIDCLIKEGKKYAIIIENKINDAIDQNRQLERYIESIKDVDKKNIFLIYLTLKGNKKPSENGFTSKAQNWLDADDTEACRFIASNYRNDILPWLKQKVLPEIRYKDELFLSCLKQYIDYLEGRFGLRKKQLEATKLMLEDILRKKSLREVLIINSQISELESSIVNYSFERAKEILFPHFEKIAEKHFKINNHINTSGGYFQLYDDSWPSGIHFEWYPLSLETLLKNNNLVLRLDVEGKNKKYYRELIHKNFEKEFAEHKFRHIYTKKGPNSNALYMRNITLPNNKTYLDMAENEADSFFSGIYDDLNQFKGILAKLPRA